MFLSGIKRSHRTHHVIPLLLNFRWALVVMFSSWDFEKHLSINDVKGTGIPGATVLTKQVTLTGIIIIQWGINRFFSLINKPKKLKKKSIRAPYWTGILLCTIRCRSFPSPPGDRPHWRDKVELVVFLGLTVGRIGSLAFR